MNCVWRAVRQCFYFLLWITLTLGAPLATGQSAATVATRRPFTVHDSIGVAVFSSGAVFSPDGRYFVTVTERGVLPEGATQDTVWLFDVSAVKKGLASGRPSGDSAPVALASVTADINSDWRGLTTRIIWQPDSRGVLFLARAGGVNRRLFRARLGGHQAQALTSPDQDVVDFDATGGNVVFLAGPGIAARLWDSTDPAAPDIETGPGKPLIELLYPAYQQHNQEMPTPFELWQIKGEAPARPVLDSRTGRVMTLLGSYNVSALALSPDGRYLVAIGHALQVPASWARYSIQDGPDVRRFRAMSTVTDPAQRIAQADFDRPLQYELIDLDKGSWGALLDAPLADFQRGYSAQDVLQAAWASDGERVAVAGSYLPLTSAKTSTGPCGVAVVEVRHERVSCLLERSGSPATSVGSFWWAASGRALQVQSTGASTRVMYLLHGTRWQRGLQPLAAPSPPLQLKFQQDLNHPPVLMSADDPSTAPLLLFDPNPQLAQLALGDVSVYTWRDPHGRTITGGLAKPPGFVAGHRYPLVIQTHGFAPHTFFNTGLGTTSTAGRALASRGMLVLQVNEPDDQFFGTWQEGTEDGTHVYLAAVAQLSAQGMVDDTKVGITGYSRQGFYVAKAITDAPANFAAAAIANADPGSLVGYDSYIDYALPTYARMAADVFAGTLPYGDGMKLWLERAPAFLADRIQAPVLISAADPQHLLSLWGIYAPLRDLGKPVELQYIRGGQHDLSRPLEVLAHEEMLVDWFDFWLNGHEDDAPDKAAQYMRWRTMRARTVSH